MTDSANDPFYSAKRRLTRARKHASDLEAACVDYINSRPYEMIVEPGDDGITKIHKLRLVNPIPHDISDIASDALDGLRSALDHMAYGAAIASGVKSPEYAYFPFSNTAENWENRAKGLCKDIPADITALFRSRKPYKTGNDALWALNEIRGANQHALLVPVANANVKALVRGVLRAPKDGMATFNPPLWTPETWDRRKNEMIIAKIEPGGEFNYDFEFTPFVAFDDVPVFQGEAVLGVISYLAGEIASIDVAVESECRRLGFIS